MYMIQLLLPLWTNGGEQVPKALFEQVREELVQRFGGLTAYTRTPASGLWQEKDGETVHDEIIVYEVMAEELDESWWSGYRGELEQRFSQEKLVIRAQEIRVL
jgi:hypothetical protein